MILLENEKKKNLTTNSKAIHLPPIVGEEWKKCVICSSYILYRQSINSDKNMKRNTRGKENSTEKPSHFAFIGWREKKNFRRAKSDSPMWHSEENVFEFSIAALKQISCIFVFVSIEKSQCNSERWQIVVDFARCNLTCEWLFFSICDTKKVASLNVVPAHCSEFINNRASRHRCSWKKGKNPLHQQRRKENICLHNW